MGLDPAIISPHDLVRFISFSLYAVAGWLVIRRLYPRLSSPAKYLASVMLVAQVALVALALELQLPVGYQWIFNLDREWNIPTTVASTQLALVAAVALAIAWLLRGRPWPRFYFVAMALMFLYLARDELFIVHEAILNWRPMYATAGALVVFATLVVARSAPRSTRIWHVCFVGGLALTGFSAIVLDHFRHSPNCVIFQPAPTTGCWLEVLEESLEFMGIWISLIGMLGQFSAAASTPPPLVRRLLLAFPALWILAHPPLLPFIEYRFTAQPTAVKYEENISLKGYRVDQEADAITVVFFTQAASWRKHNMLGYSVHLVDQATGESLANASARVNRNYVWKEIRSVFRQQVTVAIPPEAPANRAVWLALTFWREEDGNYPPIEIVASDRRTLGKGQVVLSELVLPAAKGSFEQEKQYVFDSRFGLDRVDLPAGGSAGARLAINFAWSSEVDGGEDIMQFLHFYHEESDDWWGYDQQPLGPRLPTRLWYKGLADAETWEVPLALDLASGRYQVFTGLYRASDIARLPVYDTAGQPFAEARVPLGSISIEKG